MGTTGVAARLYQQAIQRRFRCPLWTADAAAKLYQRSILDPGFRCPAICFLCTACRVYGEPVSGRRSFPTSPGKHFLFLDAKLRSDAVKWPLSNDGGIW